MLEHFEKVQIKELDRKIKALRNERDDIVKNGTRCPFTCRYRRKCDCMSCKN